jgi:hypothetical protein
MKKKEKKIFNIAQKNFFFPVVLGFRRKIVPPLILAQSNNFFHKT